MSSVDCYPSLSGRLLTTVTAGKLTDILRRILGDHPIIIGVQVDGRFFGGRKARERECAVARGVLKIMRKN